MNICVPKSTEVHMQLGRRIFPIREKTKRCELQFGYSNKLFEIGYIGTSVWHWDSSFSKQDGNLYPGHTIYGMFTSLQSTVWAKGSPISMLKNVNTIDEVWTRSWQNLLPMIWGHHVAVVATRERLRFCARVSKIPSWHPSSHGLTFTVH